jgi:predicted transcriptional regulator of viral defense system
METYNLAVITKRIVDSPLKLYTTNTLKDFVGTDKESTLHSIVRRLIKAEVLEKIEKGKYILCDSGVHDFELANFLYTPSYISFESALNLHGILSQIPFEITSATSAKSKLKKVFNKVFSFTHIDKRLFWGYEKKGNFLIATAEKAFIDQLYISAKGLKSVGVDEYDLSHINKSKFKKLIAKVPESKQFDSLITKVRGELGV